MLALHNGLGEYPDVYKSQHSELLERVKYAKNSAGLPKLCNIPHVCSCSPAVAVYPEAPFLSHSDEHEKDLGIATRTGRSSRHSTCEICHMSGLFRSSSVCRGLENNELKQNVQFLSFDRYGIWSTHFHQF